MREGVIIEVISRDGTSVTGEIFVPTMLLVLIVLGFVHVGWTLWRAHR